MRGLLTGKFDANSKLPENDVRRTWDFRAGAQAEALTKFKALRDVLTQDGHSPAQAALGWLWAHSERFVSIPGFKTVQRSKRMQRRSALGRWIPNRWRKSTRCSRTEIGKQSHDAVLSERPLVRTVLTGRSWPIFHCAFFFREFLFS